MFFLFDTVFDQRIWKDNLSRKNDVGSTHMSDFTRVINFDGLFEADWGLFYSTSPLKAFITNTAISMTNVDKCVTEEQSVVSRGTYKSSRGIREGNSTFPMNARSSLTFLSSALGVVDVWNLCMLLLIKQWKYWKMLCHVLWCCYTSLVLTNY